MLGLSNCDTTHVNLDLLNKMQVVRKHGYNMSPQILNLATQHIIIQVSVTRLIMYYTGLPIAP